VWWTHTTKGVFLTLLQNQPWNFEIYLSILQKIKNEILKEGVAIKI